MMEDLKEIMEELGRIRTKYSLKFDDNCLLENSVKIFISQNIQREKYGEYKDRIETKLKYEEAIKKPLNELATSRQLYFFRNNNLTIPKGLTKQEATRIINEFKGANK